MIVSNAANLHYQFINYTNFYIMLFSSTKTTVKTSPIVICTHIDAI